MLEKTTEMREVATIKDVICNKCGRSCRVEDRVSSGFVCVEIRVHWGFFSHKDLASHQSHICEGCYDKLVAGFVIPPVVREHSPFMDSDPFND